MTLSMAAQKDLHKLAHKRVEATIQSVTQLLDDDDQILHLTMSLLVTMTASVAHHMQEIKKKPDGSMPGLDECYCNLLSMLAEFGGVTSSVLSEKEAREAGLIKE
jgi:hypothetical protein